MNKNEVNILDFLEGKLDAQESAEFQARIDSEPALKEEVEQYQLIQKAFLKKRIEAKMERIRGWEAKIKAEERAVIPEAISQVPETLVVPIFSRRKWVLWSGVAAAVLAGIFLFLNFQYQPVEEGQLLALSEGSYQVQEPALTKGIGEKNLYEQGLQLYLDSNYVQALEIFQKIPADTLTEEYVNSRYLSGHCYLNLPGPDGKLRFRDALENFAAVENDINRFNLPIATDGPATMGNLNDLHWYQALSYLGLGKKNRAKNLLQQISTNTKSDHFQEDADRLLQELEEVSILKWLFS